MSVVLGTDLSEFHFPHLQDEIIIRNLITAAYSIDGSTYYVRSFYSHSIPYYKTGIEIPVRVSEKNPAHAMLPHDLRTAVLASVITGAAFVFVLIVSLR